MVPKMLKLFNKNSILFPLFLFFSASSFESQTEKPFCYRQKSYEDPQNKDFFVSKRVTNLEKEDRYLGASKLLFDEHCHPQAPLLQILQLLGMPLSANTLNPINDWAQKNLLRQRERWDKQTDLFESLKSQLLPLLDECNFLRSAHPHLKKYRGAIVHGALLPKVRSRLGFLVEQWKEGVRFSELYFVSSDRPLDAEHETTKALLQSDSEIGNNPSLVLPKTECEMMGWVWERSDLPSEMREHVRVHFINAPMKKDPATQTLLRPSTNDATRCWLALFPPKGNYLVVSNAPYTNRQDLVMRTIAPKEYGFDTIGPAADGNEKMAILLDELARCIFQTKNYFEKIVQKNSCR
jgi:hypothetical protein